MGDELNGRGAFSSSSSGSGGDANVSPAGVRSAPEQNASPAPVTTTARIASSASQRDYAQPSSSPMRALNALRWSGRDRVTTATPSITSNSRSESQSATEIV
jgi:hypothetical protein